jgi:hypothetical protein
VVPPQKFEGLLFRVTHPLLLATLCFDDLTGGQLHSL